MATSPRSSSQDSFWVFGEFELDASRFELRRSGERVAMQRKPLQLLIYLCRNSERLVPSPELLARVWDVAVTEASLRGAIKVLRRTLLGSATIESSRGYGYRFVPTLGARSSEESLEAPSGARARANDDALAPFSEGESWAPARRHVFVGRQEELGVLERALSAALRGDPGPVLVAAPAGTGKTWLTREFARRARARGFRPLVGQAWEGGGTPAFWPFGPILDQLASGGESVSFERPADGATTRFRLFADVVALLRRRAEQEPLLLVFEDLHWAEESTLLLLKFAVEQLHGSRVLLVGTYRDTDLEARAGAARLVGSLQARGQQLLLKPFSPSEVVSLLEAETSLVVTESLVARVLHWTGGNPLFVRELLPLLEQPDSGQDFWQANIPAGIREAIRAQLGPLRDEQRTVLTTSALLGDDFDFALLDRVVTLPRDDVQRSLRDAVARRVLTQIAPGKYRFAHALIREVLTSELSATARAEIHHRIGLALETSNGTESAAAALAFHFEQALPVLGSAREPIRYALAAARTEMARHAYEQARDHCLGALSLANDRGSSVEERGQILLRLGEAQRFSGAIDEAKSTFCALAELGRSSRTPALIADAALGYGRAHKEAGLADQRLVKLLEDALEALPHGDDALRAELLGTLARALLFDPLAPERRMQLSSQAVEIARRSADPDTLSLVLASHALATWGAHNPEILREWPLLVGSAIDAAEHARHFEALMEMRMLAVTAALQKGQRDEALASLELAEHLARRLQHPSQLYFVASTRVALALYEGRLSDVPELKAQAHALGRHLGRVGNVFEVLQSIVLARESGDMHALVERAQAIALATNSALAARTAVVWIYTEAGLLDVARREFASLSVPLLTSAFDINWLCWFVLLGRSLAETGSSTLYEPLYRELAPYSGFVAVCGSVGAVLGHVSLTLGMLARELGNLDASRDHLQSTLEETRRAGARPEQARAHLELARTLFSMGRRGDAVIELEAAEGLASDIGMKKILHQVFELRKGRWTAS